MGDVLVLKGQHTLLPWYRDPALIGSSLAESGFAVARFLPEDTYVPPEHVLACLTAALWWGKALDISWMQMELDGERMCEVPLQHHRKSAAIMYIDDDDQVFGVLSPGDFEPLRINACLVTDIHLVIPPAKPHTSRHVQGDGSVVLWSHVSEADMKADGFVRSSKSHTLDDRTVVPVFVDERGYEFSPLVVVTPAPQVDG